MAKRGRPASFDRSKALERAMELFWARGYEGATLEDLQAAMGDISPPSFYNAFGSKERLFQEATELYLATVGAAATRPLEQEKTARSAIEAMLRATAEAFSMSGKPRGCLLVLGALRCAPASEVAQDYLFKIRQRAPQVIKQRLQRAIAEGEMSPTVDIAGMAAFYATVVHGLAVRAGDGAARKALMAAVDGAMAAWHGLIVPNKAGPAS